MKKVVVMFLLVFLLTGCMKNTTDNLKSFKDYNGKKTSYELTGTMKLISNEDEFTYDLKVGVKNNEFYKVSLVNTVSNHEQVILKNKDGVYVITPNLNKSFRFQSEWPNNSSQAYLLESLVNDLNKDAEASISEEKDNYVIKSKVDYPNNAKLDNEVITTDKKFNVTNVQVKDETGATILEVKVNDINYSPKFNDEYFALDSYITDAEEDENKEDKEKKEKEENCISTCNEDENCKKECTKNAETKNTGNILDEIIYPLYVPTDTYLSSKDTVTTDNGNRVILTFAGVDPFILVEEVSVKNKEMEIIPVSGEPLLLGDSIGALTSNSLYWTSNGVDYYLTSNTLNSQDMMTIAESITNSSSLVASLK